jgi:hypothetical protein
MSVDKRVPKKIRVSLHKRVKKKIRLPNFDSRNFYEPSRKAKIP